MFTLIKNGRILAPQDIGVKDLLLVNDTIVCIGNDLPAVSPYGQVTVHDAAGCYVIPGLIDQHVHLIGGGGEGGFSTRTPEVMLSDITTAGITTVVGTLGTDSVTRHMESLLAKARGLEEEGISTWIYTGAYDVPVPTLTGSVRSDIIIVDKVIGVGEVAMSDHRSSQPSRADFAQLAAQARVGGMLSGKAGVLHLHMGDGKGLLDWVFEILATTDLPVTQFTPTHFNKNKTLFAEGIRFAKAGGFLDITTSSAAVSPGRVQPPEAIELCLAAGLEASSITMSSDGNGSLPVFNAKGELTGLMAATPASLYQSVKKIVESGLLPLSEALLPVTVNPAKSLKLAKKGRLAPGYHGDVVILDGQLAIRDVFAKGRCMVKDGQTVVKGVFEK